MTLISPFYIKYIYPLQSCTHICTKCTRTEKKPVKGNTQTDTLPPQIPALPTFSSVHFIFFLSATEKAIFSLTSSISIYFTFAIDKCLLLHNFFTSAAGTLVYCCTIIFYQCSGDSGLLLHNYFLPVQRGLLFIAAQLFFTSAAGTLVYCCTIIFYQCSGGTLVYVYDSFPPNWVAGVERSQGAPRPLFTTN